LDVKLAVHHVTRHVFDQKVRAIALSLRLMPVDTAAQKIMSWDIAIDGAQFGDVFTDGAGDRIRTASLYGPLTEYEVVITGLAETSDTSGVLRGHREKLAPLAWMQPTRLTASDAAIRKIAERAKGETPLALAHDLSARISEALAYKPGSTEAGTSAIEALKLGQGVCQDFAHLMIASALERDLPARYVTGYLAPREDDAPHEASHAWAEVWIEGLGWVGFDPANACCPDEHYLRVGTGRDAEDAAPIRGSYRGASLHVLDVQVSVTQQQSQSQS
jgi:transglutaminase-like putative cysteine protease